MRAHAQRSANWRRQHLEYYAEYNAAWHRENRGHRAQYGANWRRENPGYHANWARGSREHRAEYGAKWRRENPEAIVANAHRYRARKAANGGSYTVTEWREKCALFANLCAYCGEAKPLVVEHKIPISRGGTNDITNIVPACQSCNLRKGRKTAHEFLGLIPEGVTQLGA